MLVFRGYSDDIFAVEGDRNDEQDNCDSGEPMAYKVTDAINNGLYVVGTYDSDIEELTGVPCWTIGISQLDEGEDLPVWDIRFDSDGHTPILVITGYDPETLEVTPVTKD